MESVINSRLPEFSVPAFKDGRFLTVSSNDLKGMWAVLFFYPADFTFVCPTELEDMAENYEKFKRLGTEIYSVSTDTQYCHKAWHDTSETIKKIRFAMLSDKTGSLADALGILNQGDGLAYRGTFVADPDGIIRIAEIIDNGIGRNAEELLRKIEAAQFVAEHSDQVCPARWRRGNKTLKPGIDLVGKI